MVSNTGNLVQQIKSVKQKITDLQKQIDDTLILLKSYRIEIDCIELVLDLMNKISDECKGAPLSRCLLGDNITCVLMNDDNDFPSFPGSPDELTRPPEPVTGETTDTINDQDVTNLIADDSNTVILITPTDNDGPPIEVGNAQPAEGVNQPIAAINNQPVEIDGHRQQATDIMPNLPSPIDLYIANDNQIPLSTELQIFPIHVNTPDDDIELIERTTSAEPVEHEDDDIHIEQTERTASEPVESPVQHERINNQIHNLPGGLIDVIDLTQEDDEGSDNPEVHEIQSNSVVSPITIDLTQDDDESSHHPEIQSNSVVSPITIDLTTEDDNEQEGPIQMNSGADHNEQMNRPANDSPVVPITEQVALAAAPSLESTDQNLIYSTVIDHHHQTIETTAQLQVPRLLPRNKKRSLSSDEIRRGVGQHLPGEVKRVRHSAV